MICRMFGTFEAERSDVKIVYGLVDQPQFWNPVWHQVSFFTLSKYTNENLFKTERRTCSESQKRAFDLSPSTVTLPPNFIRCLHLLFNQMQDAPHIH